MKLLQFGGSSSFLKSMKFAKGGNHDSIVRLRCLFFTGAILHWYGNWATRGSEERCSASFSPLDMTVSIEIWPAVMADNLRWISGSVDGRRGEAG